jgi:hypothetical protein
MSDSSELGTILAAMPVGAREAGEAGSYSLAVLPCLGAPLSTRHYPVFEEL